MAGIHIKLSGAEALEQKLREMNAVRFDAVVELQAAEMVDRATASHEPSKGGTPYSTDETRPGGPHGELLQSVSKTGYGYNAQMGYTKEYAPHVEYGHRTVDGGWVPGQRFLQTNVETQRPIYYLDLLNAIKKG